VRWRIRHSLCAAHVYLIALLDYGASRLPRPALVFEQNVTRGQVIKRAAANEAFGGWRFRDGPHFSAPAKRVQSALRLHLLILRSAHPRQAQHWQLAEAAVDPSCCAACYTARLLRDSADCCLSNQVVRCSLGNASPTAHHP
jgi:hypothetical protein